MAVQDLNENRLTGGWLNIARIVWISAVLISASIWILGSREIFFNPPASCVEALCDPVQFSLEDFQLSKELDLPATFDYRIGNWFSVISFLVHMTVAGFIFLRKSDDRVGLLVSFMLVTLGAILFTSSDDVFRRNYPQWIPLFSIVDALGFFGLALIFAIFPDGRVVHPRLTRLLLILMAINLIVPLTLTATTRLEGPAVPSALQALAIIGYVIVILIGLYSQIYRYRRVSNFTQRQQTKWVLFGLAGTVLIVPLWGFIGYAYPASEPSLTRLYFVVISQPTILTISLLIPLTVAFSVFKYRLFDIDRLVNRTLVYGILGVVLALLYFGGILLLQSIFQATTGQQTELVIVLSTLTIAAIFTPLRRRIQELIDRRFYRHKYDAAQTLAGFSAAMRAEVDLNSLTNALLSIVEETMQPMTASVWLQPAGNKRSAHEPADGMESRVQRIGKRSNSA